MWQRQEHELAVKHELAFCHLKNENNNTHLIGTQNSVWLGVNAICVIAIIMGVSNWCTVKEKNI